MLDNAFTSCKHHSQILLTANYDGTHLNVEIRIVNKEQEDELDQQNKKRLQLGLEICDRIIQQHEGILEICTKTDSKHIIKFSMKMFDVEEKNPRP